MRRVWCIVKSRRSNLAHVPRREPEQARSRARVDKILEATAELLRTQGVDQISMTDIASTAGMSKAALYRYFPGKPAIIRSLARRVIQEERSIDEALLASYGDTDAPIEAALRGYFDRVLSDPYRIQLRAAVRADVVLADEDFQDAVELADAAARVLSPHAGEELANDMLLVRELVDGAVALAARQDDATRKHTIDGFVHMATSLLARRLGQ